MTAVDPRDASEVPLATEPVTAPPAEGVLGRTYRALTLGIISVVSLIAFEASAVTTAMPAVGQALDGIALYAFAFSAYFTASLFAMALSGEWCDRGGPLAPLFTGIATFGAGLVVAGCAPEMWLFVVGRGVQGIGGGLVIVALYVVVSRAYPEALRPSVLAAFSAAWVLPVIVGPLVAGTVTEQLGWRWVFLSIPVLVLLPLTVMLPALRKLPPGRGRSGWTGAASCSRSRWPLAPGSFSTRRSGATGWPCCPRSSGSRCWCPLSFGCCPGGRSGLPVGCPLWF